MTGPTLQFTAQRQLISDQRTALTASTDPTAGGPLAVLPTMSGPLTAVSDAFASALTQIVALDQTRLDLTFQIEQILNAAYQVAMPNLAIVQNTWRRFAQGASAWITAVGTVPTALPNRAGPLADWLGTVYPAYQTMFAAQQAIVQQSSQPPSVLPLPGQPSATEWATSLCQQLVAAVNACIAYTASDIVTTGYTTAVAAQGTLLTHLDAEITDLQTTIASGVTGLGPDTLAVSLAAIADLRVFTEPERATAGDPTYPSRVADLITATETLLGAAAGGLADGPTALIPFRLETRFRRDAAGGMTLRIRIFPDDISVDSHDPDLTPEEASWAATLQLAVAVGGDRATAAWATTAAKFGAPRTGYLNAVNLTDSGLVTHRGLWPRPAVAALLPTRWLGLAYDSTGALVAAGLSTPVTQSLHVAPDQRPTAAVIPIAGRGSLLIEPALAWLVDYEAALAAGMAVELRFDGGAAREPNNQASTTATIARLIVIGLQTSTDAGQPSPANLLADTLTAHRFTGGMQLVAPGTPTNNTDGSPSGYSSGAAAFADSYAREVTWNRPGNVTGDAARVASALGIAPDVLAAAGNTRNDTLDAQAMAALTWPASWGTILPWLGVTDPAVLDQARSWTGSYLVPSGPVPSLRIGSQLYGILPALALQHLTPDAVSSVGAAVARAVSLFQPGWSSAGRAALTADLDTQLSRTPVSATFAARVAGAVSGGFDAWLGTGFGLMGYTPDEIRTAANDTSNAIGNLATSLNPGSETIRTAAWPAGLLTLPDPAVPPWQLTAPAPEADDAAYLSTLLTTPPSAATPVPTSLLAAIASQAWQQTPGTGTSTYTDLVPRALLPIGQPPPPATAAGDELHAATAWLATRPDALTSTTGGWIDALSHRLDAWATAVATERLSLLRQAPPQGAAGGHDRRVRGRGEPHRGPAATRSAASGRPRRSRRRYQHRLPARPEPRPGGNRRGATQRLPHPQSEPGDGHRERPVRHRPVVAARAAGRLAARRHPAGPDASRAARLPGRARTPRPVQPGRHRRPGRSVPQDRAHRPGRQPRPDRHRPAGRGPCHRRR